MKEANTAYVDSLTRLPAFVAEVDGELAGFLALEEYGGASAEISVIAVTPALHRNGVGHALIARARIWCSEHRARWLHVKARGPSTPDPYYERTRSFFAAEGFDPLFESLTLWGPEDACLVFVQAIQDRTL